MENTCPRARARAHRGPRISRVGKKIHWAAALLLRDSGVEYERSGAGERMHLL